MLFHKQKQSQTQSSEGKRNKHRPFVTMRGNALVDDAPVRRDYVIKRIEQEPMLSRLRQAIERINNGHEIKQCLVKDSQNMSEIAQINSGDTKNKADANIEHCR